MGFAKCARMRLRRDWICSKHIRSSQPRFQYAETRFVPSSADARSAGKTVGAYGAAAKGNTLLNYCGIGTEDIALVADRNPHKQGQLLPGSHIPIVAPEVLMDARPDFVLILPWNLRLEIMSQLAGIREWGGKFVTPVPTVQIWA